MDYYVFISHTVYMCMCAFLVHVCVNSSSRSVEADVPDSCLFNVDIVTTALCQRNIDTSLLGVPLVRRKLSIGQSVVS